MARPEGLGGDASWRAQAPGGKADQGTGFASAHRQPPSSLATPRANGGHGSQRLAGHLRGMSVMSAGDPAPMPEDGRGHDGDRRSSAGCRPSVVRCSSPSRGAWGCRRRRPRMPSRSRCLVSGRRFNRAQRSGSRTGSGSDLRPYPGMSDTRSGVAPRIARETGRHRNSRGFPHGSEAPPKPAATSGRRRRPDRAPRG